MKKFIGDKRFYRMVFMLAIPIIIQNGITNFVSLLDNIMIGQVGTEQMNGVSIVNQLMMVFNISIFGIISGASIFGTQFFGNNNHKGMKEVFRFKCVSGLIIGIIGIVILLTGGEALINFYITGDSGDAAKTLAYGKEYLSIIVIGLIPYVISQVYSSSLREMGKTVVPMAASVAAVITNLILNYILIFGNFGMPQLGVSGAAIATVVSKYLECLINVFSVHIRKKENPFIDGAFKGFEIPASLTVQILKKGSPLMLNEILWSMGMAVLTWCYSGRGLDVVAGLNISTTISNMFNVVYIALGSAVSIIVGQLLGAGKMEEAKDTDRKLIFFSVAVCFLIGGIMAACAPLFPRLYNTYDNVKVLARYFITVAAIFMPVQAFMHATYFTLRSGGKTIVTFLFDSVFVWVVSIPIAYALTRFTGINIILAYFLCQSADIIKCIIGFVLVKKGVWINNIVSE